MFQSIRKPLGVIAAICAVALIGVAMSSKSTRAQEETAATLVGTFNPQQVAQESGFQAKMQAAMEEKFAGLQERAQAAQQAGDQAAMQEIQAEAQQIQMDAVAEFQTTLDEKLPEVAKQAGVDVIAVEFAYTAPGIETKDLTTEIVAALSGGTPPVEIEIPATPQAQ